MRFRAEVPLVKKGTLLLYNVIMLSRIDARIARKIKHRLLKVTPVKRLMVYGSRARRDADSDSDLDLYIEDPAVTPDMRRKISEITWEVSLEPGIVISTMSYI